MCDPLQEPIDYQDKMLDPDLQDDLDSMDNAGVKILELQVEGFKRITAVHLVPTQNGLTVIGGRNDQGKTSALDAIAFVLGGQSHKPSEVKNKDAINNPPYLRVVLNNGLVVERKGKNSSLIVTDQDGKKGGQGVLDKFVEQLALDLPKFVRSTSKQKGETLLKIIGVGDKLTKLDAEEKRLYDQRTLRGRDVTTAAEQLKGMQFVEAVPDEIVSSADVLAEIDDARKADRASETIKLDIATTNRNLEVNDARQKELESQMEKLRSGYIADVKYIQEAEKALANMTVPDIDPLQEQLANLEKTNEQVRSNMRYADKKTEVRNAQKIHGDLENEITNVRISRARLLDNTIMPLPGLDIVEGELVFEGAQWDCMSGSDQLIVSTSIVRALNPECGFVLVDTLEQMDVETMNEFGKWAHDNGLQIIATRVSTGDECSIIIEDGQVVQVA